MSACAWDSGSATGCRPLCDAPATVAVTYDPCGSGGPLDTRLCDRHAGILPGRIYPGRILSTVPA